MSIREMQILQIENEELRKRVAELTKQLQREKAALYLEEIIREDKSSYYLIRNHLGMSEWSFQAKSDDEALQFFEFYKANYRPVGSELIQSVYRNGCVCSLLLYKSRQITYNGEPKINDLSHYVIRIELDNLEHLTAENMDDAKAIEYFNKYLDTHFSKMSSETQKRLITK